MVKPTPSRFNPDLLARESTVYSVNLPLRQFGRLREMLLEDDGEMQATFRFSRRKKTVHIAGNLKASLSLQCQRCLEPMQHEVDETFELVFAKSLDAANAMPDGMDPVVLDEHGQIHVVDLFEDELILHLPSVAKHAQIDVCEASEYMINADRAASVNAEGNDQHDDSKQEDKDKLASMKNGAESDTESGAKNGKNGRNERDGSSAEGDKPKPFDVLKNLDLH